MFTISYILDVLRRIESAQPVSFDFVKHSHLMSFLAMYQDCSALDIV